MMFTEALAIAIVKGEKTATRRVLSDNPRSPWWRERCTYDVDQVFTVNPGRGVYRCAEAKVTAVAKHLLAEVQPRHARMEGFPTRAAFVEAWAKINGAWDPDQPVWVVEFELAGLECLLCDDGEGCPDCFGTGVDVWPEARELIAKVEREAG